PCATDESCKDFSRYSQGPAVTPISPEEDMIANSGAHVSFELSSFRAVHCVNIFNCSPLLKPIQLLSTFARKAFLVVCSLLVFANFFSAAISWSIGCCCACACIAHINKIATEGVI